MKRDMKERAGLYLLFPDMIDDIDASEDGAICLQKLHVTIHVEL